MAVGKLLENKTVLQYKHIRYYEENGKFWRILDCFGFIIVMPMAPIVQEYWADTGLKKKIREGEVDTKFPKLFTNEEPNEEKEYLENIQHVANILG